MIPRFKNRDKYSKNINGVSLLINDMLPEKNYLNDIFEYHKGGILTFKERPLSHFGSTKVQKNYNHRIANTEANTRVNGVLVCSVDKKSYPVDRLVWRLHTGEDVPMIHHINGIRVDNRIENLEPIQGRQARSHYTAGTRIEWIEEPEYERFKVFAGDHVFIYHLDKKQAMRTVYQLTEELLK